MVPVGRAHVGCVNVAIGAAGGVGTALIVSKVAVDVQLPPLAVTL